MKVTILGCGGSGGVPVAAREPGGFWGACDPANPKNRRRRVSVHVEESHGEESHGHERQGDESHGNQSHGEEARGEEGREAGSTSILIDTSPDLRLQLLDNGITRLDAVLFTHAHGDHCHGIDDLRSLALSQDGPVEAFMDEKTHGKLIRRFDYVFASSQKANGLYPPLLQDRVLNGPFQVGAVPVVPFAQTHGRDTSMGYRFGPAAYSTDLSHLDEAAFAALEGVRLWIVDCLRYKPHPTHAHFEQTLEWIERVKPERAILTHMNHEVDYDDLLSRCPPGVEPGYDGLVVEL